MKDADPQTRVVVVTMGPEQTKSALKHCLQSVLIKPIWFATMCCQSDTLATSYVLSYAVKAIEEREGSPLTYILRKAGRRRRYRHVGPQLAEYLNLRR